jgi:hypothetical protein
MVIPCLPRAFRCAVWAAILVLATCLFTTAASAADPFADSFASGGKRRPAHRVTKKKKTTRTTTRRRKPARPSHARAHGKHRPGRPAPTGGGEDAFAAPQPQREAPERDTSERDTSLQDTSRRDTSAGDDSTSGEAPRSRRAAEPDEAPPAQSQDDMDALAPRRAPPPRRPVKKHKPKTDDDGEESSDEEDDATPYAAPTATQPVIAPRAFLLALGGSMMGRSFKFDAPLQRESSFPRIGYLAGIETYPLKLLGPGWADGFGLAASYASEVIGKATVTQTDGTSSSTSVSQSRWNLDLRYAFELGGSVVLAPDIGLTSSSFTLSTNMPVMASQCDPMSTMACVPDTSTLLLQTGAHARFALGRELAVTLDAAFLQALIVKNKPLNQIGYEAGTSANGFNAALGATYMLTDFLAVHGEIPFMRLTYKFHNPPDTPYKSATETYYGVNVSLAVFTD